MNTRKLALRPIFLFTVFTALFVVTSEAATLSSNCASTLKLVKEGPFFSSGTENSDIRFSQDGVYEILAPLPDSILEAVADSNYSSGPIDSITRSDLYPYISALNELIKLPSLQAEMKKQIRALLNDRQEAASKNAKMREEVKNTKSLLSVKEFTLERPPELVRFLDGEGEFILGHRAEGQSDESSENSVSVIDFRKPFSRFLKIYMKGNHEQLLLPVTFTTEEIGGLIFQQPIRKILLSPDSRSIAVLDRRRLILIPMPDGGWKNEKCPVPIVKENILRGERDLVLEDLFFLGSGQFLLAAVSGVQGGLFIIDSQTFDIVSSVKNQSLDKQIRAIDLSRDGKRVAVLKRSSYGFRNKWWRRARWPTSVEIYDFERLFGWAVP